MRTPGKKKVYHKTTKTVKLSLVIIKVLQVGKYSPVNRVFSGLADQY